MKRYLGILMAGVLVVGLSAVVVRGKVPTRTDADGRAGRSAQVSPADPPGKSIRSAGLVPMSRERRTSVCSSIGHPVVRQGSTAGTLCTQPGGHCQLRDNFNALTSNRLTRIVADDFTVATSTDLTQICWWGAYAKENSRGGGFVDCQGQSSDTFEVRYYRSVDGVPGTLLASFSQQAGTLTVAGPSATGALVANQIPEYAFTATHAAVPVLAGQCYWVEISNQLADDCRWSWEISSQGNGWGMQDGTDSDPPDHLYDRGDSIITDLSFCLNLPLGDASACLPVPPDNDDCGQAAPIVGTGTFTFDNSAATTDGPRPVSCPPSAEVQLESDVWYCWTAPCTETAFISTCGQSDVDTMIAVYEGCDACPPVESTLRTCNDDRCGVFQNPRQSMVAFQAVEGQRYRIRVGSFPGERPGTGTLTITCGPPVNAACPGAGNCCDENGTGSPACDNQRCCESVCACDPFCCTVAWDKDCAERGILGVNRIPSLCGAQVLCSDTCDTGSCCEANGTPGCSNLACADAVCACDSFCCDVEWDQKCATTGSDINPGCGAQALCQELCVPRNCPAGSVTFVDPPHRVVDARQPYEPGSAGQRQGIHTLVIDAPAGADAVCFSLCETAVAGLPNEIVDVVEDAGRYTLTLARPITLNAITRIAYTNNDGGKMAGQFTHHPANVNSDTTSNAVDILVLSAIINDAISPPWGTYSADIDFSGSIGPGDLLRAIDLLNGADAYSGWMDQSVPTAGALCP